MFRRLLRWCYHLAAAVSLLLVVGIAGLWWRSWRYADWLGAEGAVRPTAPQWGGTFTSSMGHIEVTLWRRWNPPGTAPRPAGGTARSSVAPTGVPASARQAYLASLSARQWLGFVWACREMDAAPGGRSARPAGGAPRVAQTLWLVGAPDWALLLAAGTWPAWWLARYRHRQAAARRRTGCCPACGYDLRASKERCPECGTPIPVAPVQTADIRR